MLKATFIGNVGADARVQSKDNRSFATFRVAHNDTWKDAAGVQHSTVTWVDCILNGDSKVIPFIKAGTQVAVEGTVSLRVYSSEKDRCMKAGMTINVRQIELLGGSTDEVPKKLFTKDGVMVDVKKYYHAANMGGQVLMSQKGQEFAVDDNGWVVPMQVAQEQIQGQENQVNNPSNGSGDGTQS